MATLGTMTMGELNKDRKPVHPLFQKPAKPREASDDNVEVPISSNQFGTLPLSISTKTGGKADKKSKKSEEPSSSKQTLLFTSQSSNSLGQVDPDLLEVDPNGARRKRRKTASPAGKSMSPSDEAKVEDTELPEEPPRRSARDSGNQKIFYGLPPPIEDDTDLGHGGEHIEALTLNKVGRPKGVKKTQVLVTKDGTETDSVSNPPGNALNVTPNPPLFASKPSDNQVQEKPKKILKFNPKTGTIGSPPAKKPIVVKEKGVRGPKTKSKIVTIRYGPGLPLSAAVGLRIDQILNSPKSMTATVKKTSEQPKPIKASTEPPKSLHPLFLGKSTPNPKTTGPRKVPTKATCVIDLTGSNGPVPSRPKSPTRPAASTFAGFGASSKILKFPGAVNPAWPWEGMVHIRGTEPRNRDLPASPNEPSTKSQPRKSKYVATQIQYDEDLLRSVAAELDVHEVLKMVREINLDDYPLPPESLRLPSKHLESGQQIQRRIRAELHAHLEFTHYDDSSEDELRTTLPTRASIHPALTGVYNTIKSSLSAFDNGQCETQAWIHKYSPKSASEVLQIGREALILRDWLQTLTVNSVEGGLGDRSSGLANQTGKSEVPGKRKRKSKKPDDFIVSSDEESDLDEITEPEDDISLQRNPLIRKTVIRSGDGGKESGKLKNAVLISGPHGSGKTATVYAVAKELGFEVFEINSSSRRSGKDIMEKVGDMTRNHQVQRQHIPPAQLVDEENQRIEQALADDIQSGRQGTMISFFKPKDAAKLKPKAPISTPPTTKEAPKEASKDTPIVKLPPKEQKQSLILIEEVDVLYEEDKHFWATVMALMVQSKRPIIMTCNDESLVPDLNNALHAIIRFNPPPVKLATDYMLLVAACEGHVLRRESVKSLYESRDLDLRASIAELNFWCQFGVGDQKHGGDWFYRRYPGKDLDAHGHKIRVVSEDTYHTGMGWVSRDFVVGGLNPPNFEQELLHELWDGWNLDAGDWQEHLPLDDWAKSLKPQSKLSALEVYDDFAECMSLSDLCSASTFAPHNQLEIDTSLPTLTPKALNDYVLGRKVLQVSPAQHYHTISKDLSIYLKSQARNLLHTTSDLAPRSEKDIITLIRQHTTSHPTNLRRQHLSLAFDPISYAPSLPSFTSTSLEPSIFDRTISIITVDVAPYVRGIVAFDARLHRERLEKSNLLSEGGSSGGNGRKRIRTTRAALSALEGGRRGETRRERWFSGINAFSVARTGGEGWM